MQLDRCELQVKQSPIHGYGVFAGQNLAVGDLIEECHILIVQQEVEELGDHLFNVTDEKQTSYLPLGFGAIYNHSPLPNASYSLSRENTVMEIVARENIKVGEEIFVSYGSNWFDSRYMKPTQLLWWPLIKRFFATNRRTRRFILVTVAIYCVLQLLRDI